MTDPLLTIEDATREFRVSPKTIRRRLTSGEIDGAYKRAGSRGPEWVMPRDSLAAAGFAPRSVAAPAALPSDAEARASYWEQRAVDAEAAMRSATGASVAPRAGRRLGGLAWASIGIVVLLALIAGAVVLGAGGDADDAAAPSAPNAMSLVVELLERETEPGDAVGLVGERRTDALPTGRVAAPSPRTGWDSPDGPRYAVATFDGDAVPASVRTLRASSEVVLRTPHGDMVVEVYDRRSPTRADRSELASPEVEQPVAGDVFTPPAPQPSTEPADPAGDEAPEPNDPVAGADATAPNPTLPAPTAEPSAPAPGTVQVVSGESFWSIAEDVVAAELGPDASQAAVTAYWSMLVRANGDRLVEAGNADLLHVGQTIMLPSRS